MSEQNIEFSSDENILIVKGGKREGEYQAKTDGDLCTGCNFWAGDFFGGCSIGGMLKGHCGPTARKDGQTIIWTKKENTEMTEALAPAPALQHRHFDLIVAWAKNPTQPVWFWNVNEWQKAEYVVWHMEHYAIGEKPTMPPVKMVKYDGGSVEFPKPAMVELEHNKQYWAATIYGIDPNHWTGHSSDFDLLENGLIQLTKEGAQRQSDALVELLKNHAQKWG